MLNTVKQHKRWSSQDLFCIWKVIRHFFLLALVLGLDMKEINLVPIDRDIDDRFSWNQLKDIFPSPR